jgi:DsbC/DsbD-like thiol-disulfide interchange protein
MEGIGRMSIINAKLGSVIFAASTMVPAAFAQPNMGGEHLTISAKTDFSSMHAGEAGLLAIEIVVADEWHTYWPGVSDTGFGVSFEIDAPNSIELKDPIWPSPIRYLQEGEILDHTYEGTETVLYPFVIKEDADLSEITFKIEANFLVCKDLCLPGSASASTSFEIVSTDTGQAKSTAHDALRSLYENRPVRFSTKDPAVRLQWIKSAAAVIFRDATRIEFYPDNECTEVTDLIKDGAADGNRLEIYFSESENKRLSGRIRIKTPFGEQFYDIDEKAP